MDSKAELSQVTNFIEKNISLTPMLNQTPSDTQNMTLNITPGAIALDTPDSLYKSNNKNDTMTMLGRLDGLSSTPKHESSQETE